MKFLRLLVLVTCIVAMTAVPFEGTYVFDAKQSESHLPLFSPSTVNLTLGVVNDDHFHYKMEFDEVYGVGDDFTIPFGEATPVAVSSRVYPTNVFQGFSVDVDYGKNVKAIMDAEGEQVYMEITYKLGGSQGEDIITEAHTISLFGKDTIHYVIEKPIREHDVNYTFTRAGFMEPVKDNKDMPIRVSSDSPSSRHMVNLENDVKQAYMMHLDDDWSMSGNLDEKTLLLSLQGLANVPAANLYFLFPKDWDFTYTQNVYDFYSQQRGYNFTELTSVDEAIMTLAAKYANGYVVFDKSVRVSVMVAFTISGLEKALVVSEKYIPLMEKAGLSLLEDLRGKFTNMSDVDIYSAAWDQYGPHVNRKLSMWLGGQCGDVMKPSIADYGVNQAAFHCDLSCKVTDTEEYALSSKIMASMEPFNMIMGWHSYCKDLERDFTTLSSNHAQRVLGLNTLPNLSFSAKVSATPGFVYKNHHHITPGKVYKPEKKTYITAVQTDGIGLGAWTKPGRGDMPYAWEAELNFYWLAPAMLEYFYTDATDNDYFIGALGGPGYVYPKAVPKDKLPQMLQIAKDLMTKMDIDVFEIMDYSEGSTVTGTTDLTKEIVDAYYANMPNVTGFLNGYAPSYTYTSRNGVPLVSYDYYLDPDRTDQEAIDDLNELAAKNAVRPYFLLLHVREWGDVSRTKRILDGLGDDFKVVALDVFLKMAGYDPTFKEHYEPAK